MSEIVSGDGWRRGGSRRALRRDPLFLSAVRSTAIRRAGDGAGPAGSHPDDRTRHPVRAPLVNNPRARIIHECTAQRPAGPC